MNGFEILLLVLVLLAITAAAVILLRKRQGKARAQRLHDEHTPDGPVRLKPGWQEDYDRDPDPDTKQQWDGNSRVHLENVTFRESQSPKTPRGSRRVERTLDDDDIVTTPAVIYGGSAYAAPVEEQHSTGYDPTDHDTSYLSSPSPAPSPAPAYDGPSTSWGSSSGSSDSGSSSSGSDSSPSVSSD